MIAYHILCHGDFKQVARLIESLYSEEDTFLIDIDDGQKPNTRAIASWLKKPNVHVTFDGDIGWGGAGTLRKTIKGAFRLLELDSGWDYYIVLSGQDLPLKSNRSIKDHLAARSSEQISYLRASCPPELDLATLPIDNTSDACVLWGDRGHTRIYAKPGTINPQTGMYARRLVDVTEVGRRGEVYVGTADSLLQQRRDHFFRQYPFHVGANWFNLHRSVLEHMVDDPFTYELFDVIRTTFIPDESFFQTYIMNSPFKARVSHHHGRLILRPGPIPRVKVLDMSDWDAIESSNDLFARKFDARHDKQLIKRVLTERR
ncbi:MAG: beta-1,6-N-acetylglucosaminyltransferase [Granulosicoccus sp.]|nr:beta-1,6-N-acetylglucosaminyltransferase [Granulosicoccus sp.]